MSTILNNKKISIDHNAFATGDIAALTRDCNKVLAWVDLIHQKLSFTLEINETLNPEDYYVISAENKKTAVVTLLNARGLVLESYDYAIRLSRIQNEEGLQMRATCLKAAENTVDVITETYGFCL